VEVVMARAARPSEPGSWVLLSYRVPREPSTPRITIWRKLKRLGVAQISDGLVALPADARTREQLEWIADEVVDAGGSASIWLAQPGTVATERELAAGMASARAEEYVKITAEARASRRLDWSARQALVRRLRADLLRIQRRDYFPPVERDAAGAAVDALAATVLKQEEQRS
jgi:Protein ChrB, N-terminal